MPEELCEELVEQARRLEAAGAALLLFSPGGFNATLENRRTHGVCKRTQLLAALERHWTCIAFDKRSAAAPAGAWSG